MKKIFHKNQLIITTLAFMIAIAGYISYDRVNNNKEKAAETNADALETDYVIDNSTYDIFEEPGSTETMGEEITLDEGLESEDVAITDGEDAASDAEETLNPGETVLTSVNVTGASYAAVPS